MVYAYLGMVSLKLNKKMANNPVYEWSVNIL
jgi:hypothetical protein